ncbi:bifunctional glycosyltransferase/CDP-glycerol:glycerophosphate glycerophosphotransferase [Streptomyces sp. PR69]|uniref:bifunctional glycosyltransferase/CDP-glycerol:glycerophosphate glycerophosphotransferase n=1 Tax=Streptomyces sp. PR69 TaxID=2984950 RepID=UPI0022640EEC|nr:bifunctional glycosyltransferase/CDP-glycerol:glycerophosphate glycerophosphotransferase [Streptomyces sp. PR69]
MAFRLSVVVPVYNVAEYLDACLRSLAGQTCQDLEVVMVDDGSTDESADIARAFAARDERFRLLSQQNAGLGAARNAGAREATGTYLAFVDSDDVVPQDAYARMLTTLEQSGSDFATGNVHRLRASGKQEQSPMFREPMAKTRTATHVTRHWPLLYDRIACNKVFRRDFWDRHGFAFPEGVLFEDIPVIVPAHFLAASVDVLHDTVYLWRDRDGSITTRRARPAAVRDRARSVASASGFLAAQAKWPEGKRRYDSSVLSSDLKLFMDALPDGDEEYRQAFLDHAGDFARGVAQPVLDGLPFTLRAAWHLVRERRIEELLALLAHEKRNRNAFHIHGRRGAPYLPGLPGLPVGGRAYAEHPAVTGGLPKDVSRLGTADLPVLSDVVEAVWRDGRLRLRGYAYVRNLPAEQGRRPRVLGWLRHGRRRAAPLRLRPAELPEATAASRQSLHRYDLAGFETVVDPARLRPRGGRPTTWNVEVGVLGGGMLRRGPLRMLGNPAPPAVHYLDDSTRIVPELNGDKLRLKAERVPALLTGHGPVDGEDGTVAGAVRISWRGRQPFTALRVENRRTKDAHEVPAAAADETDAWHADVPLALFTADSGEDAGAEEAATPWTVRLVRADGGRVPLGVRDGLAPGRYHVGRVADERELVLTATAAGNLALSSQCPHPIADAFAWTLNGGLVIEGSHPAPAAPRPAPELVLRHSATQEEAVFDVRFEEEGRFRAELTPAAVCGMGGVGGVDGEMPLAEGRWYLFFRDSGEDAPERCRPVRLAAAKHAAVPAVQRVRGRDFTLTRRFHDQLVVESGSVLGVRERGPYGERRLRERYAELNRSPERRDTLLFSSFDGRQYSDSPRAVHEELLRRGSPFEHLWTVRDQQVQLPEGVRAVAYGSTEWHEALARSRAVVTNTQLPEWYERGTGRCTVQTWHGTPLKRIGRDLLGTAQANRPYIDSLPRRAAQWDLLISPNRFSTPILRRAFGYEGEVLESGYPRNALLHAEDRHKIAASVRERLGIEPGRTVVLYAPTWREDRPKGAGRYALDLRLDLAEAQRALGGSHVLLVRRHYLVGDRLPQVGPFVRDVSRYPDVAELLLISDVLVTDYSSLMFDFAQTGRPMLFHTYDLEHYRDTLRGFYFDFEAKAPGPLVREGAELIEALREPEGAVAGHVRAYEAFREVFCDLDDGRAAGVVADRLLGLSPALPLRPGA